MTVALDVAGLSSVELTQLAEALTVAASATWIDPPAALALARLALDVRAYDPEQVTATDGPMSHG